MSPATSIRHDVVRHVVARLRGHPALGGASVEPGWPGDKDPRPLMVWAGDLDGTLAVPVSTAGRKIRDDIFQIQWLARASGDSLDEAVDRLFVAVAAIEDELADHATLEGLPGVVETQLVSSSQTAGWLPEGAVAYAEVMQSVHARYH